MSVSITEKQLSGGEQRLLKISSTRASLANNERKQDVEKTQLSGEEGGEEKSKEGKVSKQVR